MPERASTWASRVCVDLGFFGLEAVLRPEQQSPGQPAPGHGLKPAQNVRTEPEAPQFRGRGLSH
jgi:hypothetical protein